MESLLPLLNPVQLPDRTAAPLHETRRRPGKLPIIPGAQLTLSRAKLCETLYKAPTDFLSRDPAPNMKPDYNSLHDPHLRDYYHRRDLNDRLKKANFVTADNEVICSLKEYNTYEEYIECLKAIADKTYHEKQLRKFIELQEKGLIPEKLSTAEMEAFLEKDLPSQPQRRAKVKEGCGQSTQCLYRALDMERIKEEDRTRLMMYEKEYRHEQKREKYLKEAQELRNRKKQASMEKVFARKQNKIMMEFGMVKEVFPEDAKPRDDQRLLPARPRMKHPDPHSDMTSSRRHKPWKAEQKQASVLRESAVQQKKSQVQSSLVKIYGQKGIRMDQKQAKKCYGLTKTPNAVQGANIY